MPKAQLGGVQAQAAGGGGGKIAAMQPIAQQWEADVRHVNP